MSKTEPELLHASGTGERAGNEQNKARCWRAGVGTEREENDSKGGKEKERDVADTEWT